MRFVSKDLGSFDKLLNDGEVVKARSVAFYGMLMFGGFRLLEEFAGKAESEGAQALVFDFTGVTHIDTGGATLIKGLRQRLNNHGIKLLFAGAKAPVVASLVAGGCGKDLYPTDVDAIAACFK